MGWKIRISDEAKKDYRRLDGSLRKQVLAGIIKVSKVPLPSPNGYGKPLGNNLTGFFKIKCRKLYEKYGEAIFKDIFDDM